MHVQQQTHFQTRRWNNSRKSDETKELSLSSPALLAAYFYEPYLSDFCSHWPIQTREEHKESVCVCHRKEEAENRNTTSRVEHVKINHKSRWLMNNGCGGQDKNRRWSTACARRHVQPLCHRVCRSFAIHSIILMDKKAFEVSSETGAPLFCEWCIYIWLFAN